MGKKHLEAYSAFCTCVCCVCVCAFTYSKELMIIQVVGLYMVFIVSFWLNYIYIYIL